MKKLPKIVGYSTKNDCESTNQLLLLELSLSIVRHDLSLAFVGGSADFLFL
jgi:hypothetical protein